MPFSIRSIRLFLILTKTVCILVLYLPTLVQAETKTIVSEATYSMGDGETPSLAEAMVLQKAKQRALEEAGTYVESYAKVRNLDLTEDEIQTIAGGVLHVEVLEKKRSIVGEGFQFFIKIRATVTTDKMEELAQRVRGRNVAEEYKRLQDNYSRLTKEFETLKFSLAKSPAGPGRVAALDQTREREREFRATQQSEATFLGRLISGETLFSNAVAQLTQKENERQVVENLFNRIVVEGYAISLGEPTIHTSLYDKAVVSLSVPVTIKITENIKREMEQTARSLGGLILHAITNGSVVGLALRMGNNLETVQYFQKRIANLVFVMGARLTDSDSIGFGCYIVPRLGKDYSFVGTLGIAPVDQSIHSSDTMRIDRLGPSLFDNSLSARTLSENAGFVVILKEPVRFTLKTTTLIRLEAVRQIRSLTGSIVEGIRDSDSSELKVQGLPTCSAGK